MSNLYKADKENIIKASRIIRSGGLVVFPTETVYGLGADALNEEAVVKIFEAKKRPSFDPLIIHIYSFDQLKKICKNISKSSLNLINKFWPGPLTIILERKKIIPDIVTSGLQTAAIRMPSHPVAIDLLKNAKTPIAAPSANRFGYITPTRADMILKQLGHKVDMILDDGKTHIGLESTIISMTDEPVILRPGGITKEQIEKIIGKVKISHTNIKIESPGQLKRHYSPGTKTLFLNKKNLSSIPENSGVLLFKGPVHKNYKKIFKNIEILSKDGNLHEAAKNLFSHLYNLDEKKLNTIYVEKVPEEGIGIAIMDRLRKATHQD